MAHPSLAQARHWLEQRFDEVHIYNSETHPAHLAAYRCPNGIEYLTVINGQIVFEGDKPIPRARSQGEGVSQWFDAMAKLYDLFGGPKYLWWRDVPGWCDLPDGETGYVYCRMIMTHGGP